MVRAKFRVDSIQRSLTTKCVDRDRQKYDSVEVRTVCMTPVFSNDPDSENRQFWEATPSGKLELGCVNLEAAQAFELGQEYYIDFTKAESE